MTRGPTSRPPLRSAVVMGLGHHGGGVAAARFLARQGAVVTISDTASAESLAASIESLRDVAGLQWKLGGHDPADFRTAKCVVVNPAVRPDHACLQIARQAGACVTSEIELFLARCRAPVIAVTGSSGKSSTSTMLAQILTAAGQRTWLGGNIGVSLLPKLPEIDPDDWVVLELSSFQLAHLSDACPRMEIAVVTNCAPNHLDWHRDYADYRAAKQRLIAGSIAAKSAVLNTCDVEVAAWRERATGEVLPPWPLEAIGRLHVAGAHQRSNAACAAAAADSALRRGGRGLDRPTADTALAKFSGLPHRLQRLPDAAGRQVFNDSKSTTPAATLAAIGAVDGAWLLLGGRDKGADFGALCAAIVRRTHGVAVFGEARERLRQSIAAVDANFPLLSTETLHQALEWCFAQSRPGEAILLSPACASLDQFRDYAERGEQFARLVAAFGLSRAV